MTASARAERAERITSRLVQLGFVAGLVVLWYLATERWGVSGLLLPKPAAVLRELADVVRTGEFITDLRITLGELAAAFAIAASAGIVLGYLIGRSSYSTRAFEPLLAAIYAVPIILLLPLYVLFFGLGPASKIALGASIGFFPVVLSTIAGFAGVDRTYTVAARSMGCSGWQLFRWVLLPAALPVILAGLRLGSTVSLLSILGAETISSVSGLGHRIVSLGENMDMARMFAYIAFAAAIAMSLNAIVSVLEARWRRT
jgi:ABC-type nitrate/sulfonate/bicarbonate transport system permease component